MSDKTNFHKLELDKLAVDSALRKLEGSLPAPPTGSERISRRAAELAYLMKDGSMGEFHSLNRNAITADFENANAQGGLEQVHKLVDSINAALKASGSEYQLKENFPYSKSLFAHGYDLVGKDGRVPNDPCRHMDVELPPRQIQQRKPVDERIISPDGGYETNNDATGEKLVQYPDGARTCINKGGQLTEMTDIHGRTYNLGYDANGAVNKFTHDGRTFVRQGEDSVNARWINEAGETHYYGRITPDAKHGRIRTEYRSDKDNGTFRLPPSIEIFSHRGHLISK
jgi:hypothetical protein